MIIHDKPKVLSVVIEKVVRVVCNSLITSEEAPICFFHSGITSLGGTKENWICR